MPFQNADVEKKYAAAWKEVQQQLDEIKEALWNQIADPDDVKTYGHVGTLDHYNELLHQVSDSLLKRGEFAK